MNAYKDTFLEYFSRYYYNNTSWRAYIEHYCSSKTWYSGELWFYHFSHTDNKMTQAFNFKILKFIEEYYGWVYEDIKTILVYAIQIDAFISIISQSDTKFILKISQWNQKLRKIISAFYTEKTGKVLDFPHENFTCPIEISFHLNQGNDFFHLWICQKVDTIKNLEYREDFIEENNIFLMVKCLRVQDNSTLESNAVKLYEPIKVKPLSYIDKNFYTPFLSEDFSRNEVSVNSIEIWQEEDIIYFTHGYIIES